MDIKHAKLNKEVTFIRRNGETASGKICAVPEKKINGTWVKVNTGDKKKPVINNCRLSALSLA